MARLGERLPVMLAARGIDVAFGVAAPRTVELYRGIDGSGLRHIAARSETGAGFMADGFARACGRPAAVLASDGPGLAGLVAPMAQALHGSTPMLAITVCGPKPPERRARLDAVRRAAAEAARLSRRIEDPAAMGAALDDALTLFAASRPGPVHLEIPESVLASEAPDAEDRRAPPEAPRPSVAELAEMVMRIGTAHRPLMLCGAGAVGAGALIGRLAERLQAPVLLTSAARGLVPPDHRLYAGGWLHTPAIHDLIARADLVLAIGTGLDPADFALDGAAGAPVAFPEDGVLRVDIDPERLDSGPHLALGVAADAGAAAAALLENLPQRESAPPDMAEMRNRAALSVTERYGRHQAMLEAIWKHLPDAVVIGDVTEPARLGRISAAPPAPRRWWASEDGFGSVGYALPAAIGAKVADHRRPVVALIGDVGALRHAVELTAAVEAGAHVVALVWNNSGSGGAREAMQARGVKPVAVDLAQTEHQALARAVGAAYARVHSLEYLRDALKKAVMRPGPSLLELREEFWFET